MATPSRADQVGSWATTSDLKSALYRMVIVAPAGVLLAPAIVDVLASPASSGFLSVRPSPRTLGTSTSGTSLRLPVALSQSAVNIHDAPNGQLVAGTILGSLLLGVAVGRARDRSTRSPRVSAKATAVAVPPATATPGVVPDLARRGVLPNGLRYIVLRHPVPPGRVEAHLEFHVGSVDENDDQQGMAHMLEHICFLGSQRRMTLQSGSGMTSNALTDFQHTIYHLSMDVATLPDGLEALKEIGFTPAFESARVEKERAAVLSEAQMVNDCTYRLQTQIIAAVHPENKIHQRFPIGMQDQITRWTQDQLREFHRTWYVPENATLHIVGDVDEAAAIAELERVFGGTLRAPQVPLFKQDDPWTMDATSLFRPSMPSRPVILHDFVAPDGSSPAEQALMAKGWTSDLNVSISSNELMQGMQVCWAAKTPLKIASALEDLNRWLCHRVVVEAVRVRLQARWRSGVTPCAFHLYDSPREATTMTTLTVMSEPAMWRDTCQEVLQEVLAIARYGITAEEMDRARKMTMSRVADAARTQPWSLMGTLHGHDAAGTSRQVVEAVIASMPCGHLLTRAETFSSALQEAGAKLELEQVNAAIRELMGHFGGIRKPAGTVVVSCPAFIVDGRDGRRINFDAPSESEIVGCFTEVPELDEQEVRDRCISVPTSLMASTSLAQPVDRRVLPGGGVSFRLPCGLRVRLLVRPGSVDAPARGTMRLTAPGGRAAEMDLGHLGAFEAGLKGLASCGVGDWSREQVQLYLQLNSVTTEFRACADVGEIDAHFVPTADSSRAALEWFHELLREPKMDLEGFAQAQMRMKGEANAREKSIEGKAMQILKQDMYPGDQWLWEATLGQVNFLTCGQARKALMAQVGDISQLELDIAGSAQVSAGGGMGLSHAEDTAGDAEESAAVALLAEQEKKAVNDMLSMLEHEVCRTLGSLPAAPSTNVQRQAPSPTMAWEGCERRFHVPDSDERAMALIAAGAPGYWGTGDTSWAAETSQRGFSWGDGDVPKLYPAKATELMIECLNNRLLGRVRDQLSLTYSCDVTLTMYDGFPAGNIVCKVFSFPDRIPQATNAALDVLRSPSRLPFMDREVEAAKKGLALRASRERRESGHLVDELRHQDEQLGDAKDGDRILDELKTFDVQRAWGALTGLDDPFVVIATSGPPHVPSLLPPYAIVSDRRRRPPPARPASEALENASVGGISMDFLD